MSETMVSVERVSKDYGLFSAISDISFSIAQGQVVGFLGPNGAGKTTTMKIITGFMPPSSGSVTIEGYDLFENPQLAKKRIGYLPEVPPLYPDMIVREFLRFAALLRSVERTKLKDSIDRAIEVTGLEPVADRVIANCSKGYRQRVGIAQALVHSPKVLILDEPTVGLDPVQIVEIRELIKSLSGERTVILSTHILPEVSAICERVIMINAGRLVGDGSEEELSQSIAGSDTYYLAVKGEREKAEKVLKKAPSVEELEFVKELDGVLHFRLQGKEVRDPRQEVSLLLAKENLPLYELRPPGLTLEEVFVRLTSGEEEPLKSD